MELGLTFDLQHYFWLPWQPRISHVWARIIRISLKNQLPPISTIFTWFVPRDVGTIELGLIFDLPSPL